MSIPDIFATHGEPDFRAGEARVIARLLDGGPQVLATGGGAFMNADTRAAIGAKGVSIWLKADFDVLMRRIKRRHDRPLLHTDDPAATLQQLIDVRYPVYGAGRLHRSVARSPARQDRGRDRRGAARRAAAARRGAGRRHQGRHRVMTAPLRASDPIVVDVALGERSYDIVIGRGQLASLGARIAKLRPGAKVAIVSDENVAARHLDAAVAAVKGSAAQAARPSCCRRARARNRSSHLATLCDELIAHRIERNDLVVALGGGVIGDLAGFAAAIVRRGIDYVQVPTSLLAQVDSSVGGKTAIDSPQGKNLIGAFHQPVLVIADTALLDTLPPREFRAGYAEVAKYGLLGDAAFFAWLEANWQDVFAGGPAREHAIATSCRAKAAIVARDERETGDRMLLNLGHTFGHALEAAAGYSDRLLHGEAIAIGMALRVRILGAARPAAAGRGRARDPPPCGGRPADPCFARCAAACRTPTG